MVFILMLFFVGLVLNTISFWVFFIIQQELEYSQLS